MKQLTKSELFQVAWFSDGSFDAYIGALGAKARQDSLNQSPFYRHFLCKPDEKVNNHNKNDNQ